MQWQSAARNRGIVQQSCVGADETAGDPAASVGHGAGNYKKIEIKYLSDCSNKEGYLKLLKERTKLDIIKGYTTKGIHRDDFVVYINEKEVNIYGSQGQNRTVILTLKLSELQVIYEEIGEYPILLLDDFMSELDEKRRNNFLNNIKNTQVIITCTDKLELNKLDYKLFNVKKGEIY